MVPFNRAHSLSGLAYFCISRCSLASGGSWWCPSWSCHNCRSDLYMSRLMWGWLWMWQVALQPCLLSLWPVAPLRPSALPFFWYAFSLSLSIISTALRNVSPILSVPILSLRLAMLFRPVYAFSLWNALASPFLCSNSSSLMATIHRSRARIFSSPSICRCWRVSLALLGDLHKPNFNMLSFLEYNATSVTIVSVVSYSFRGAIPWRLKPLASHNVSKLSSLPYSCPPAMWDSEGHWPGWFSPHLVAGFSRQPLPFSQ